MKRGFSLVELSIVLVILGLLVGGILAGQSLIRAAELRAVSTEFSRYTSAMHAFRDKYFSFPGDMANATSFWGAAAACPGISSTAAGGTCNGNGDGRPANNPGASLGMEKFRMWQHMALAGLIEGTYSGTVNSTTATNYYALIGYNVPRSKLGNAGWSAESLNAIAVADVNNYDGDYGNAVLFFGGNNATGFTNVAVLKAEEAWNIDTKMDDGKPATGSVLTFESQGSVAGTTGCGNLAASGAASLAASAYRLDTTSLNCTMIFKTGY